MMGNIDLKIRTYEKKVSPFGNKVAPIDEGLEIDRDSLGVGDNGSTDHKPGEGILTDKDIDHMEGGEEDDYPVNTVQ